MKPITALIAATILSSFALTSRSAAANSVEIAAGHKYGIMDARLSREIAPGFGVYVRTMPTVDYTNNVSFFGLADATANIVGNIDVVAEVQAATDVGLHPRIGAQYSKTFGDLSLYALATATTLPKVNTENVLEVGYRPSFGSIHGVGNIEIITNAGKNGLNFALGRGRLGIGVSQYEFGVAIDLTEIEQDLIPNYGGFLRTEF